MRDGWGWEKVRAGDSWICGILVPWPGTETGPLAVKVQSPNHWTAKELPPSAKTIFCLQQICSCDILHKVTEQARILVPYLQGNSQRSACRFVGRKPASQMPFCLGGIVTSLRPAVLDPLNSLLGEPVSMEMETTALCLGLATPTLFYPHQCTAQPVSLRSTQSLFEIILQD